MCFAVVFVSVIIERSISFSGMHINSSNNLMWLLSILSSPCLKSTNKHWRSISYSYSFLKVCGSEACLVIIQNLFGILAYFFIYISKLLLLLLLFVPRRTYTHISSCGSARAQGPQQASSIRLCRTPDTLVRSNFCLSLLFACL